MIKENQTLLIDANHKPVQVSGRFQTLRYTIQATATWEEIELPDGVAEILIKADGDIEVADNGDIGTTSEGDELEPYGFPIAQDEPVLLGVARMSAIHVQGTENDEVYLMLRYL